MPAPGVLVKCAMMKRTPAIHLFYCANSVTETELQALQTQLGSDGLRTLSLPCSGKATIPYLLKAFEKGADGVVLCTCPESQCRHLEGNLRASRRTEAVAGLLDEIGFGKGCVVVVTKEQGQSEKLIDTVQRLQAELGEGRSAGAKPARAVLATVPASKRRENAA
jgi:coenzyme F420-reducing hydrogenase delta subunit